MKIIKENINIDSYTGKAFNMYFGTRDFAVFDIETTGLSPVYSKLILSGLIIFKAGTAYAVQYFSENENEEKEVLTKTIELLEQVDYIITYNGKRFDIPFIITRAKKYDITFEKVPYDLDLYPIIKNHSPISDVLPRLNQKSIEYYMGLSKSRFDEIDGAESVKMYMNYQNTKSKDLEKKILLHNHDDILQLLQLLPIIRETDFHKAMFYYGFFAGNYVVRVINVSKKQLTVKGTQLEPSINYETFPTEETPYRLSLLKQSSSFELTIPCEYNSGGIFFDAKKILGDLSAIEKYPSFIDGYLLIKENSKVNFLDVNAFIIEFFRNIKL